MLLLVHSVQCEKNRWSCLTTEIIDNQWLEYLVYINFDAQL